MQIHHVLKVEKEQVCSAMDYDILAGIIPPFDVYSNRSDNHVIVV